MSRPAAAGALLLALTLPGWWIDARVVLAAWLAAWWWCLGLVLGCCVNTWMHRLSGGEWGHPLRLVAATMGRRMPALLLALVPLVAGLHLLYPWAADPQGEWRAQLTRPDFTLAWLSGPFFIARMLVYAAAWWWMTHAMERSLSKGRTAAALVLYALVTSLAAVDLLMSLLPVWYSTAFGLVLLAAQALGGAAWAVLILAWAESSHLLRRSGQAPALSRDLGNLLLMWTMSWAYLAFMQFLIIWAENLPREIAWYVPRLQTGWRWAGLALVLLQLVLPFVALLFRNVKDRAPRLAIVAAVLLAATALDAGWLVMPSVAPHSLHGWWLLPLSIAGMGMLFFGGVPGQLRAGHEPSGPGVPRDAHA